MSDNQEEHLNWAKEAQAVIEDIKDFVSSIVIAESPKSDALRIYFDLETLEKDKFIIAMDSGGFSIVSQSSDSTPVVYETINALLDSKSLKFRNAFASSLLTKINSLVHDRGSI